MPACVRCASARAQLRRPRTGEAVCRECFFLAVEAELHATIVGENLFRRGERVAVAASGGKDSTVLAFLLQKLNSERDYGLQLELLSIDEGIRGYRDDSLEAVRRHSERYALPLHIFSYAELYGWTMDEVVAQIGRARNCSYCGIFRRQALDRGAAVLGVRTIATGHNADDVAETVLLNCTLCEPSRRRRRPCARPLSSRTPTQFSAETPPGSAAVRISRRAATAGATATATAEAELFA